VRVARGGEHRQGRALDPGAWPSYSEPITEPDILQSIKALPTEDELPYDNGALMETARHRDQMVLLIESLRVHWAER